jgi:hypothetical protein
VKRSNGILSWVLASSIMPNVPFPNMNIRRAIKSMNVEFD